MNEITTYIPTIFNEPSLLKKHLSFMRYFSDVEWFNLLAILYQSPNATNVRTTAAWTKLFNKEIFPKKGERGIQTFLPLYKGDTFEWKIVKLFDISQMQTTIRPQYASYLQMMLNTIGMKYLNQGEEGWQKQLILNAMKNLKTYKTLTKAEIKFVMNCVLITCVDLLNISIDDIDKISLTCPKTKNLVMLYKFIKDVIANLPEQLLDYVSVMEAREKFQKEIAEATYISQMNIKQNIKYAQKIANDRLQVITDGGSDISIEDENEIGIPADEDILDEDIFKGDL